VKEELPPRLTTALDELRLTLDRAAELAKQIESQPKPGSPETAAELQSRLADVESDRLELSARLADYEHQVGRLMNLYVATYQLHATLDPAEVQSTIAEIAINLLGAERFVLLFWKENATQCEIALSQGLAQTRAANTAAASMRAATPWWTRRSRTASCAWARSTAPTPWPPFR